MFNLSIVGDIIYYADNTVVITTGKSCEETMRIANIKANILNTRFNQNYLTLNTDKTYFIPFSLKLRKQYLYQIKSPQKHCDNAKCLPITAKNCIKYLSVIVDSHLIRTTFPKTQGNCGHVKCGFSYIKFITHPSLQ